MSFCTLTVTFLWLTLSHCSLNRIRWFSNFYANHSSVYCLRHIRIFTDAFMSYKLIEFVGISGGIFVLKVVSVNCDNISYL